MQRHGGSANPGLGQVGNTLQSGNNRLQPQSNTFGQVRGNSVVRATLDSCREKYCGLSMKNLGKMKLGGTEIPEYPCFNSNCQPSVRSQLIRSYKICQTFPQTSAPTQQRFTQVTESPLSQIPPATPRPTPAPQPPEPVPEQKPLLRWRCADCNIAVSDKEVLEFMQKVLDM